MTTATTSDTSADTNTYNVTIEAEGPRDPPGESRSRQYTVAADSEAAAEEAAIEKGKFHFYLWIIGEEDSYEITDITKLTE